MNPSVPIALCALLAACTAVGDVRTTDPVRKLDFAGDYKAAAECVTSRLGGKVRADPSRKTVFIHDSVKGFYLAGIQSYDIKIFEVAPNRVTAEWRKLPPGPMGEKVVRRFWSPVRECARLAGGARRGK